MRDCVARRDQGVPGGNAGRLLTSRTHPSRPRTPVSCHKSDKGSRASHKGRQRAERDRGPKARRRAPHVARYVGWLAQHHRRVGGPGNQMPTSKPRDFGLTAVFTNISLQTTPRALAAEGEERGPSLSHYVFVTGRGVKFD